jgi:hypothetical protein
MSFSRRSFFGAAAAGGAAALALRKIARPQQETKQGSGGVGYALSEHARKYYRTAKV